MIRLRSARSADSSAPSVCAASVTYGAVVTLLTTALACGSGEPAASVSVRDSLELSIVEHSAWSEDSLTPLRLEASPAVLVGVTEGPPQYQFFGVIDAHRRRDGSIVVLDRSQTLRAYDNAGVYLWTAGRRGSGPGEFNWAQHVVELPGDTLAVWDVGPGRLSLFSETGEFVRAWTVPDVAGTALLLGTAGDGQLILEQRMMERGVVRGHPALTVDSKVYLLDVSRSDAEAFEPRRSSIQYQEVDENGAYSPAIFATAAVFAPAPEGFWYGVASVPELQRISEAQGVDVVLRWTDARRIVQEADVRALIQTWSSAPSATPELRRALAEYARTHPRADRFPSYEELLSDATGNLWVRDFVAEHEDDGRRRWTVFSADGRRLLGRLEHEARFMPLRVGFDGLLGVERDDLGVERIAYRTIVR